MMARTMLNSGLSAGPHRRRRYVPDPVDPPQEPVEDPEDPTDPEVPEDGGDDSSDFTETIPEGFTKVDDLLDWVGDSEDRARIVMDVEQEKPEKDRRKTLVRRLEDILSEEDII